MSVPRCGIQAWHVTVRWLRVVTVHPASKLPVLTLTPKQHLVREVTWVQDNPHHCAHEGPQWSQGFECEPDPKDNETLGFDFRPQEVARGTLGLSLSGLMGVPCIVEMVPLGDRRPCHA